MKKSAFVVLLMVMTMTARSSVYLFEQFNDTFMPTGWSLSGIGADYWYISETNKAGGTPNELYCYCGTQGTWRLISPAIDLGGQERVSFSFKLRFEKWGDDLTIGIATSSDNGLHWHQGWTGPLSATVNMEINEEIHTEDIGNPNVKFCIFFTNTHNYNSSDIYIDDIAAFVQRDLDMEVTAIHVDGEQPYGRFEVGMSLFNTGDETVTSVEGFYQFDEQTAVEQTFTVNVPASTYVNLSFDVPADLLPDNYLLTVGIRKVNGTDDDDPSNNLRSQRVSIACATTQRLPLFEHFTSSSCGTCPQLSSQMDAFCNNNPGKYTYVKYQMNWPAPGDPYYTNEGGVRKSYYGVISVPYLFMDADDYSFNPVPQGDFDEHFNTPAVVEIKGSFWTEGTEIHVIADLMPFADIEDVKVHVAVNEKTTHNNATINGETSFHHVMMKMLPNAQGTTMSFTAGQLETLRFDYDLAGTHVEEMDDLEVAVWIQRKSTKKVFNSSFLFETDHHPYRPENLTIEKTGSTLHAHWEAPSQASPTGYNIWLNEDLIAENYNGTSYSFNEADGAFYCVQVQAVYPNEVVSVKTIATTNESWNLDNQVSECVTLYPNPAKDVVSWEGIQPTEVLIHNSLGQCIQTLDHPHEIPVAHFPNGLYLIMMKTEDSNPRIAKIIVNH